MMTLSLRKLSQSLLKNDPAFQLVRFINAQQGFALAQLDYNAAAAAIGVSYRTVGRLVKRLADENILVVSHDKLRISEKLIAE